MSKKLNYQSALEELEKISREIEDQTISIDDLAEKVKKASELIAFCQEKLRNTDTEVNKIISQMDGK